MVLPCVLIDHGAECVLAAIHRMCTSWLRSEGHGKQVLVLTSDRHKALVRLAMHFAWLAGPGLPLGTRPVDERKHVSA